MVKKNFPLLFLVWYLFKVVSGKRHQTRGINGKALCTLATGNILVASWVPYLVIRPIFGLCHDSLNFLNSVKAIEIKL